MARIATIIASHGAEKTLGKAVRDSMDQGSAVKGAQSNRSQRALFPPQ
jgi:hypothetical protein